MDIINKKSDRWSKHLFCTGGVHTDFGCGSMLAVEVADLFYVSRTSSDARSCSSPFSVPCAGWAPSWPARAPRNGRSGSTTSIGAIPCRTTIPREPRR